jgi:hypothetical protein
MGFPSEGMSSPGVCAKRKEHWSAIEEGSRQPCIMHLSTNGDSVEPESLESIMAHELFKRVNHSPTCPQEAQNTCRHLATIQVMLMHPELPQKSRVTLDMISGSASTSLLQTYFNCLHPLWPILYKPLYSSSDYANPTNMMAPPLVAAIFAIASCIDRPQQYTPNTIVGKFPEPTQFFEEALNLLQLVDENDRTPRLSRALTPSITNCQVLTILCLQQHGVAEYSRAAILCGLASAMAIELRIHRPCESEDPIQREIQSRLWWNLYILEKMMSTEMGRPVLLRAEESDCPFPSEQEADEFELMAARPGSQGALGTPSHLRSVPTKLRTISGLHTTIKLSQIFEKLAREIYGIKARKTIRENQAEGEAKRMNLWFALQGWEREMEGSALRLDLSRELSSVPAAVTNYVVSISSSFLYFEVV